MPPLHLMGKLMVHILQKDRERMWLIRSQEFALTMCLLERFLYSRSSFQKNVGNKIPYCSTRALLFREGSLLHYFLNHHPIHFKFLGSQHSFWDSSAHSPVGSCAGQLLCFWTISRISHSPCRVPLLAAF